MSPLLGEILPAFQQSRDCLNLSDRDWLACGVCRVIDDAASGRDILQRHAAQVAVLPDVRPGRRHLFESPKSRHRLAPCAEATTALARRMQGDPALPLEDRLQVFADLNGFETFAGDGHLHPAAPCPAMSAMSRRVP